MAKSAREFASLWMIYMYYLWQNVETLYTIYTVIEKYFVQPYLLLILCIHGKGIKGEAKWLYNYMEDRVMGGKMRHLHKDIYCWRMEGTTIWIFFLTWISQVDSQQDM
jgi:hypothetical protein